MITGTTTSIQLEPAQPMVCSVNKTFQTGASSFIENEVLLPLNDTFELSPEDIRNVSNHKN